MKAEVESRVRSDDSAGDVLRTREAANLLMVSRETVCALARKGDLPARKVGREWRFSRRAIIRLLESGASEPETNELREAEELDRS